jgi:hypothetical protein
MLQWRNLDGGTHLSLTSLNTLVNAIICRPDLFEANLRRAEDRYRDAFHKRRSQRYPSSLRGQRPVIPQRLTSETLKSYIHEAQSVSILRQKGAKQICRYFQFNFLPLGFFSRLIVRLLQLLYSPLYWRDGIIVIQHEEYDVDSNATESGAEQQILSLQQTHEGIIDESHENTKEKSEGMTETNVKKEEMSQTETTDNVNTIDNGENSEKGMILKSIEKSTAPQDSEHQSTKEQEAERNESKQDHSDTISTVQHNIAINDEKEHERKRRLKGKEKEDTEYKEETIDTTVEDEKEEILQNAELNDVPKNTSSKEGKVKKIEETRGLLQVYPENNLLTVRIYGSNTGKLLRLIEGNIENLCVNWYFSVFIR